MENRIKKKVNNYQMEFKESIKKWIEDNNIIINDKDNNIINSDFIKYIYDYNKFFFFFKSSFVKSNLL